MNRKHLFIALAVVVALMIASTVGMDYLWKKVLDYTPDIEANWGVTIPREAKCDTLYGSGENTTGVLCHVITYENASYVETLVPWGDAQADAVETAKDWLKNMEITEEIWPIWDDCRLWQTTRDDGSRLMIFWSEEAVLLYVLEYFPEKA